MPHTPKLTRREREALKAEWRSELARQGGLARAAVLTPDQRSKAARKAALARWAMKPKGAAR